MYSESFVQPGNEGEKKSFRDIIGTADESGKRIWLYPKNPKGRFTILRTIIAWILVTLLIAGPYMTINGEPLLLLNIVERKFIIFGRIFWPQDFHIFLLVMLAFVLFIGLFTVVYGRIFCGWICPQTIFMESVFRKIEYWIEGDWKARMALDKAPLNANKFFKKALKHTIFLMVSFIISCTFLSYIIGHDKVWRIINHYTLDQSGVLISLILFTLVFYWVFAKFREQVCTTVCPYGRLQGVLLDKNSLVVIYDYLRGEKRGKFKKNEKRETSGKGDCIDCNHCVHVCPMGIDIRNGTQLECTNCTACMDACDFMMRSVGLKKGLIRIDSEAAVSEGKKFRINLKIVGYTAILAVLSGIIFSALLLRSDIETSVLRARGSVFQKLENNRLSNLYNIKMINKTNKEIQVVVKLQGIDGEVKLIGKDLVVPAQGTAETAAFIILNKRDISQFKTKIKLGIYNGNTELENVTTTFIAPVN